MNTSHVDSSSVGHEDFETSVSRSLVALFRPVARLCFNLGLTHRTVTNAARRAFVEVAQSDYAIDGKRPTYSRISLLTGIDRKQVVEILSAKSTKIKRNPVSDILDAWATLGGEPLAVRAGTEPNFQDLVRNHCADLSFTTLLEHLESRGYAERLADGRVALASASHRPSSNYLARFRGGVESLRRAADAVVHSVHSSRGPALPVPIAATAGRLRPSDAAELESELGVALDRCKDILQQTLADHAEPHEEGQAAVRVELYCYSD